MVYHINAINICKWILSKLDEVVILNINQVVLKFTLFKYKQFEGNLSKLYLLLAFDLVLRGM